MGGGIAGLSTAYYLQRAAARQRQALHITIVERSERLGGKLLTERVDAPGGAGTFVIEGGPDAFITQKPWGVQLAHELGLGDQLLSTNEARHKVYVLHRGKPIPLPDGVTLVVPTMLMPFVRSPLISWPGKLRMALDLIIPARRGDQDEALAAFIKRRLGSEALDKIAEPLMAGIYNSESDRLSLLSTFPRFRAVEEKFGSLIRGMRSSRQQARQAPGQPTSPFVSLRGGVAALTEALARQLDATVLTGRAVAALERAPSGPGYVVSLDDGARLEAAAVVLAAPAYAAADLLAPLAADLAGRLRQIRYVSTGTVTLAYRREDIGGDPLETYGVVIPHSEGRQINACTISSRKFAHRAPGDYVLIRAFVGGSRNPHALRLDDAGLVEMVRSEFQLIFGIAAEPVLSRVYRWDQANPQYDVGHLDRVAALEADCPAGVYLTGSPYRGVGIPDCIHQAQQTAAKVMEQLAG